MDMTGGMEMETGMVRHRRRLAITTQKADLRVVQQVPQLIVVKAAVALEGVA
jgi:hypothetical protein